MKIEVNELQAKMLETMPQQVAISVMISLAANLIRMKNGELKNPDIPDDPIRLIAQFAATVTVKAIEYEMEKEDAKAKAAEAIEKAKG
jgi:hypothetical protein